MPLKEFTSEETEALQDLELYSSFTGSTTAKRQAEPSSANQRKADKMLTKGYLSFNSDPALKLDSDHWYNLLEITLEMTRA